MDNPNDALRDEVRRLRAALEVIAAEGVSNPYTFAAKVLEGARFVIPRHWLEPSLDREDTWRCVFCGAAVGHIGLLRAQTEDCPKFDAEAFAARVAAHPLAPKEHP